MAGQLSTVRVDQPSTRGGSSNPSRVRVLKIAHLYQASNANFSAPLAANLHIYHTMRGLQQAGHDVRLVGLRDRRVLVTGDLAVFRDRALPESSTFQPPLCNSRPFLRAESGIRRVQRELRLPYLALFDSLRLYEACSHRLHGFDILHERYNLLALGGTLASVRLRVPLVLEMNADLLAQQALKAVTGNPAQRLLGAWATRLSFRVAARIVCVSEDLKRHLACRWGLPDSKLEVVPCAADTDVFGRYQNSAAIRARLGLTDEPVVMWVGGFYPWHDLGTLLEAFERLLQSVPRARLVLVGDGETRSALEASVSSRGLGAAVLMTGSVPHQAIPETLSIADIAVAPAPHLSAGQGGTGTPLKVFEYMAAGKAIVASRSDQLRGVIRDRHNGVLVEPGDALALAQALQTLLADQSERDRLARNARQDAVETHSWQQYTRSLESIYHNILSCP